MTELTHVEDVKKHVRIYISVFGALAVLTVVTVGIGYLDLPIVPALILGLAIATIKGSLVAGYFMHLITEKRLIQNLVVLSLGLLLTMFAIFVIYYFDQGGAYGTGV